MAYSSSDVERKTGRSLYSYIYSSLNTDCSDSAIQPMDCSAESPTAGNKRKYASEVSIDSKRLNDLDSQGKRLFHITSLQENNDSQGRIVPDKSNEVPLDAKSTNIRIGCELDELSSRHLDSNNSNNVSTNVSTIFNKTSPPGVESLNIAPKTTGTKNSLVNGCVTKQLSLRSNKNRFSLNDSTDYLSENFSYLPRPVEPVTAETCSLTTEEGRQKCLASDRQRWDAYQSAMSKFGNDMRNDESSNASRSNRTPKGASKRKISDYFPKATPSPR